MFIVNNYSNIIMIMIIEIVIVIIVFESCLKCFYSILGTTTKMILTNCYEFTCKQI